MAETSLNIDEPIDLVRSCHTKIVRVKLRHDIEIKGKLHAFDNHMNLLIGDAEEQHTVEVEDPKTLQKIKKIQKRKMPMTYVRGDQVILIARVPK